MRHFLQNLVDRHQDSPVQLDSNEIVQPRLKTRFEVDNGVDEVANVAADHDDGDFSGPIDVEAGSNLTQSKAVLQSNVAIPPLSNPPSITDSPIPENWSRSGQQDNINSQLNDRLGALNVSLSPKQAMDDTDHRQSQVAFRPPAYKNEASETAIKQAQLANFSLDINQRIQAILDRLNNQSEPHQDGGLQNDSFENKQPLYDTHASDLKPSSSPSSESTVNITQPKPNLVTPVKAHEQDNLQNKPVVRKSNQSGLLQTPAWLSEMRRELHTRWQQIQDQAGSEQVVNVTIGRVEVKAVSANHPRRSDLPKKPTGVMNLDDYLKQRAGKGR